MADRFAIFLLTLACLVLGAALWQRHYAGIAGADRTSATPSAFATTADLERNERLLDRRLAVVRLDEVPLDDALKSLSDMAHVDINADWKALEADGMLRTARVRLNLQDVSLGQALDVLLGNLAQSGQYRGFVVKHDRVLVTTAHDVSHHLVTELIDVRSLVAEMEAACNRPFSGNFAVEPRNRRTELIEQLARLITDTNVPDTWSDSGGMVGSVREVAQVFILTQTPANLAAIRRELARFRRAFHSPGFQPPSSTRPATGPAGDHR